MSELERIQRALPRRYELVHELDRGGMSRVYLAREQLPERLVAIKVFDEELSARLGRERFVREIEVTSRLGHPHIVPILAAGDADGALYYAMPYIEGDSLRTRLEREGRLPLAEAVRITAQVADALEHAHGRGVVHRDIKPANILFQSGHALVADFGIARALSAADTEAMTQSGLLLGTPDYMSPEQIESEGRIDAGTDIYALGCVVFEMIGGQPPFHSRSQQATFARHLADPPPNLTTLRPDVPQRIERAVRKSLAKVSKDRHGSAAAFARELQAGVGDHPGSGERRGWTRARSAFGISLRVAGTLLVVAALGFAWQAWSSNGPVPVGAAPRYVDSVAVMPFDNRTGDPSLDDLGLSIADAATNYLTTVTGVKAIHTYSVASLWHQNLGIRGLLDSLDVGSLIDGYYEVRGDALFVTVSEADQSGALLASNEYSVAMSEMSASHREIGRGIAEAFLARVGIVATLDSGEEGYGPGRTAYVTGNEWLGQRTPEAMAQAVAHFRQAIALEPGYAAAFAGLSSAYALSITYGYDIGLAAHDLAERSLAAADSAVALDPDFAGGYASRGYILALLGVDVDQAEADFATAQSLAPSGASGLSWSARIFAHRGLVEEALEQATLAVELDPVAAGRRIAVASLAFQVGQYERAVSEAAAALQYEPDLTLAVAYQGRALALLGRGDECLALELGPYDAVRALCLATTGRDEEARAWAGAIATRFESAGAGSALYRSEIVAQDLAAYHAYAGDLDEAVRWIALAFERSPAGVDERMLGSELFAALWDDAELSARIERVRDEARAGVERALP